ncbi:MAG: ATP-binding cassette domain-containing protein, partial [Bacteroidota bacterium]
MSFDLAAGEQLGMLGLSGSGKSLTAKALLGLLPVGAAINDGTALYTKADGETLDLLQLDEKDWRELRGREISMVFQEPLTALNPVHRIGRQLDEAARNLCPELTTKALRDQHIYTWLERVELAEGHERILQAYPHELSGGQRQRILIALALLAAPRLLFADEPTTALDTITENSILQLLEKLRLELGMTMVFITHDLEVLRRTTTRTIVLRQSQLVREGSTEAVLALPGAGLTEAEGGGEMPEKQHDNQDADRPMLLEVSGLHINYVGSKVWPWSKAVLHSAVRGVS